MTAPFADQPRRRWQAGRWETGTRALPEERAVALVYDGATQAVMMATPDALEDFALGFALTEGIAAVPADLTATEIVETEQGIEARSWLVPDAGRRLSERRRAMLGPVGCGLCGIDSIAEALRPVPSVPPADPIAPEAVPAAMAAITRHQALHDRTRAAHAAALWRAGRIVAAREDVGRHNALDKLAGGLARAGETAKGAAVVLTCRVSVDMVQKTAMIGAGAIIAASAPTSEAVRQAETAGITLIGLVRDTSFEVFSHPAPVSQTEVPHVA